MGDDLQHLFPNWGNGNAAVGEHPNEVSTSDYIRNLPYLFLGELNPRSRTLIETRSIELLSNRGQIEAIDVPHDSWLGFELGGAISSSHLWNDRHTNNFQPHNEQRYAELIEEIQNSIDNFHV